VAKVPVGKCWLANVELANEKLAKIPVGKSPSWQMYQLANVLVGKSPSWQMYQLANVGWQM
jgi:hypothetical protein